MKNSDTLYVNKPKRMKIETPIGSIESDSGNHFIDVMSVIIVIIVFFIAKKIFITNK